MFVFSTNPFFTVLFQPFTFFLPAFCLFGKLLRIAYVSQFPGNSAARQSKTRRSEDQNGRSRLVFLRVGAPSAGFAAGCLGKTVGAAALPTSRSLRGTGRNLRKVPELYKNHP